MIRIMGHVYELEEVERLGVMGRNSTEFLLIQLESSMPESQKLSTTLHEVLEALNKHNEWDLGHTLICSIEAGLFQVFSDNGVDLSPLLED